MSTPTVPRAAPIEELLTVDRNSATAATPSMQTTMYASASAVRQASWVGVRVEPLRLTVPAAGAVPSSSRPSTYATTATTSTAMTTKATTVTSLATSSRSRLAGRTSR